MPEATSTDSRPSRLLPTTIPGPSAPVLDEWHSRGLCIGEEPEVFFPSRGDHGTEARETCAACRVRNECLSYATAQASRAARGQHPVVSPDVPPGPGRRRPGRHARPP